MDSRSDTISGNVLDREDMYMDDGGGHGDLEAAGPQWVWLAAGACSVNPLSGPPGGWFVETNASYQSLSGEPWRVELLQV